MEAKSKQKDQNAFWVAKSVGATPHNSSTLHYLVVTQVTWMSIFWFQHQNTAFGLQVEQQQGPATRAIKVGNGGLEM